MTIPPPDIDHNLGGKQYLNPYSHMTEDKPKVRGHSFHLLTLVPMLWAWLGANPECISCKGSLWA